MLSYGVAAGLCLLVATTAVAQRPYTDKKIIMYWTEYSGLNPESLPGHLMTNVLYAFIDPSEDATCTFTADHRPIFFNHFRNLKSKFPHLQVQLSLGGWTKSAKFSDIASTSPGRKSLAQSCIALVNKEGLDGIDIDWEFPVKGGIPTNSRRAEDKENYTKLLQEFRDLLAPEQLLTIASHSCNVEDMELSKLKNILDWVNIMSYDFTGTWSSTADHNSPLYTHPLATNKGSTADSVELYLSAGMPASQIVIGVPFYGFLRPNVWNDSNGGLFQVSSGATPPGWNPTYSVIKQLLSTEGGYTEQWDHVSQVPYSHNNEHRHFLTYENGVSVACKANYVVDKGLRGIMAWEISQDSSDHELLTSITRTLEARGYASTTPTPTVAGVEHASSGTLEDTPESCLGYCKIWDDQFFDILKYAGKCYCAP